MRRCFVVLLLSTLALAQTPQSPRQALLEMIRATSPAMIDKHTPEVLLQAMAKLPPDLRRQKDQNMQFFSMMMAMSGGAFRTFETGPIILRIHEPKNSTEIEISVERDDLTGDIDTMEFGIHVSKDGKPQELPIYPRILVDMKMESGVWKLSRIGASASLQLDDPKVVAMIVKQASERFTASIQPHNTTNSSSHITVSGDASASSAIAYLRTLNTAEVTYAASYPQNGYTCLLSDLGGSFSGKSPDEHGAQLINPALEAGKRNGYRFEISGCAGTSNYRISATPIQKGLGQRNYCTDQSGVIRSASDGEDCWAAKPVN